jgi:hypothetical protein
MSKSVSTTPVAFSYCFVCAKFLQKAPSAFIIWWIIFLPTTGFTWNKILHTFFLLSYDSTNKQIFCFVIFSLVWIIFSRALSHFCATYVHGIRLKHIGFLDSSSWHYVLYIRSRSAIMNFVNKKFKSIIRKSQSRWSSATDSFMNWCAFRECPLHRAEHTAKCSRLANTVDHHRRRPDRTGGLITSLYQFSFWRLSL